MNTTHLTSRVTLILSVSLDRDARGRMTDDRKRVVSHERLEFVSKRKVRTCEDPVGYGGAFRPFRW